MKNIFLIAKTTLTSIIRDKIFYGILGFAILFILSITFFGSISLGNDLKVIKDFGLAGIYLFNVILAIFFGASLIQKELSDRTYDMVILRPVSKIQFVLGKFLGLMAGLISSVILMSAIYLPVVALHGGGFDSLSLLQDLLLIFELSIITSIALFFSVFATHLAATLYLIVILYAGHSLSLLHNQALKAGSSANKLFDLFYYAFPNLEKFNVRNSIVYGIKPDALETALAIFYALVLTIIFISFTTLLLKKYEE